MSRLAPPNPTSALGLLGLMSQQNALSPRRSSALLSLMTAHPNALQPPPSSPAVGLSIPNALGPRAPETESPGPALAVGMSLLFGGPYQPGAGRRTILGDAMRARSTKRRVFFSFHYQRDINRVNIVRKSSQFRPEDGTEPADWFDHSIWETAKRTGQAALKRLIHEGMERSSVTCVLAGTETWGRPWVRYEIAFGLARGNGLLTVFIDRLQCMKNGFCKRGPNPLDYLGLKWDGQGKAHIWENFGGQWRRYPLHTEAVSWPKWLPNVNESRFIQPLSRGAPAYDYAAQDGYANLGRWTQAAAQQAGR